MIAFSAGEIVLGKHSFLGPTDPQIVLPTSFGRRLAPAQAILDQFERAQRESADPGKQAAWLPMLNQYGPDLLSQCETALEMSKDLVRTWLDAYMFKPDPNASDEENQDRKENATRIANWLSNHKHFKSHNRHISRDEIIRRGAVVYCLEDDKIFQDIALSVFHATTHTFSGTPTAKIIENHEGRAFIKLHPT